MKRIGLFFGSFNPLTNAHVALAKESVRSGSLDETWFVLSPANPAKFRKNILADEEHRRNMLRDFISKEGDPTLKLCDIEYELPRPSYTHNTLTELKARYPEVEFVIVCGSDTLAKILSWKTGDMIVRENKFLCFNRGNVSYEWSDLVRSRTEFVDGDHDELSSTSVRGNISSGHAYNTMVPEPIFNYINQHGLYK